MTPVDFPEANLSLGPPDGMTEAECQTIKGLRCLRDGMPLVITCWEPTEDEWAAMRAGGKVWLTVYGLSMPPVILSGLNPFEEPPRVPCTPERPA